VGFINSLSSIKTWENLNIAWTPLKTW
jgi:hypothetical protein